MRTRVFLSIAVLGLSGPAITPTPANANLGGLTQSIAIPDDTMVTEVARRGGAVHVNRGASINRNVNRNVNRNINRNVNVNRNVRVNRNVNVNRNVGVNRGLYHGRYVYRGGPWVRPRNYWWPVGGAVAAGAALGMVTAASAAAWAGAAPGPDYCWYYTDPSRTQGFWDQCQ